MTRHVPILRDKIVEALVAPFHYAKVPAVLVDCTLGGGGHTGEFLKALLSTPLGAQHVVVSIDQDPAAIEAARARFSKEIEQGRLFLVHSRFSNACEGLPSVLRVRPVLGLLADLGFSSDQIDSAERGLSFRLEGPLDMRLDPSSGRTAHQLLRVETESRLADILFHYGEERLSRKIARRIVETRSQGQLPDSTRGLAELVAGCFPPAQRHGRIHPATRTFQALRIAVNDELGELDALLKAVIPSLISVGGRVAFLSFHSLEDRRVKQAFAGLPTWKPLFKKPVEAGEREVSDNPRARSAKLRIFEREQ